MKLNFIKNIQFTRLIKVNGRLREFNFRKPNNSSESIFSVDVIDEWSTRIMFNMKKVEEKWVIVQKDIPEWVQSNENVFHEIIMEELKEA